jgi:BirA family biotin operon repressor/biotin-[acetyl-CoA-carboxylase] ligase
MSVAGGGAGGADLPLLMEWEGHVVESLRSFWGVPRLEVFQVLGSTNDRVKALAENGADSWTVVLAEAQTGGRGRGGKGWDSPAGKGIWLSVLVPSGGHEADALLSIRVAMATADVLEAIYDVEDGEERGIRLKWPNDLLLRGRKLGGILCETAGRGGVVVGIGLNVGQRAPDFPPELRTSAISLADGFGVAVSRVELAGEIVAAVRVAAEGGGGRLQEAELQAYLARDALLGERVDSELGGRGVALGITPRGSLMLEREGGKLVEVLAGSVARVPR